MIKTPPLFCIEQISPCSVPYSIHIFLTHFGAAFYNKTLRYISIAGYFIDQNICCDLAFLVEQKEIIKNCNTFKIDLWDYSLLWNPKRKKKEKEINKEIKEIKDTVVLHRTI